MTGYIDPSIVPESGRQTKVIEAARRLGLSLHRVHRDGRALRLSGPGVWVTVADLGALSMTDLKPPAGSEINARIQALQKR
jgi:hypothetical protein